MSEIIRYIVDNAVFITPRKIPLVIPDGKNITHCTRPIWAETMRGERVALATSEEAPVGTEIEFEVITLDKKLDALIKKCLDYGAMKGLGHNNLFYEKIN